MLPSELFLSETKTNYLLRLKLLIASDFVHQHHFKKSDSTFNPMRFQVKMNWSAWRTILFCSMAILITQKNFGYALKFSTLTTTPISESLFGQSAVTPAPIEDQNPYVHPRIIVNDQQWDSLVQRYADSFNVPNSWSNSHMHISLSKGPNSDFIKHLNKIDTSVFDSSSSSEMATWDSSEREVLRSLADEMSNASESHSHSLFMCAFWAAVNNRLDHTARFLSADTSELCISAAVKWSVVLISHRIFTCAGRCPNGGASNYAFVWDTYRRFTVNHDWYTCGLSLALLYDVSYNLMNTYQQRMVRSALSLLVHKKESWGTTISSTVSSPNCAIHPHRCYSNWATYHSNLYLTNLAIEGESDFEPYTSHVLSSAGYSAGFESGLDYRFARLYEAYMAHSVNPDGGTFEDGYTYFIALREGSLGLVAATRRGVKLLDTPRFRNLIHNALQMSEPWRCGQIIGHASGGGLSYPTYVLLFRYVYKQGVLPAMFFRQRYGSLFQNNRPCRISWHQHLMQITFLGDDHDTGITTAESPSGLTVDQKSKLPLSMHTTRRGLLFMRNSWEETSAYVHFDARPDAIFPGHDNADRGVFTFTGGRQTWIIDLPDWRYNTDSRKHSLMHVDGLAQSEKAPSVRIIKTEDDGHTAIASADLTYAYNVQWSRGGTDARQPRQNVLVYDEQGNGRLVSAFFDEPEYGNPRDFGWPDGDDGDDIGLTRPQCNLHGDPDMGFAGLWVWKRPYRNTNLARAVRSVALVRSDDNDGYAVVVDSFSSIDNMPHNFESYMIINDGVSVQQDESSCSRNQCLIVLRSEDSEKKADINVIANNDVDLSFRTETFTSEREHSRVIIRAISSGSIELWAVMHARDSNRPSEVSISIIGSGEGMEITSGGQSDRYTIEKTSFTMARYIEPSVTSSPTPSITPSISVSPIASPSFSQSPPVSVSTPPSASMTVEGKPVVSPSPIVMGRPMRPIWIGGFGKLSLYWNHFTSNEEKFFKETKQKHQAVALVRMRRRRKIVLEIISACETGDLAHGIPPSLLLYDCGSNRPTRNYFLRYCSAVEVTSQDREGNCERITINSLLTKSRKYFLVISIDGVESHDWSVTISHRRTWLQRYPV